MKTKKSEQSPTGREAAQPTHTPTPWNVAATHKGNQIVDNAHKGQWEFVAETKYPEDAEFIVRAVNSHEALIQAVKDLRYAFYVENSPKKLKEAFSKHADKLQEIIAQAEGSSILSEGK